jgi:hypothetical protein
MLHVFIGEILANMTQVSDVAPGPLVYNLLLFALLCITCKSCTAKSSEVIGLPSLYWQSTAMTETALRHNDLVILYSK